MIGSFEKQRPLSTETEVNSMHALYNTDDIDIMETSIKVCKGREGKIYSKKSGVLLSLQQ